MLYCVVYGGYSSMAERLVVAEKAVGSNPISHPNKNTQIAGCFFISWKPNLTVFPTVFEP